MTRVSWLGGSLFYALIVYLLAKGSFPKYYAIFTTSGSSQPSTSTQLTPSQQLQKEEEDLHMTPETAFPIL